VKIGPADPKITWLQKVTKKINKEINASKTYSLPGRHAGSAKKEI